MDLYINEEVAERMVKVSVMKYEEAMSTFSERRERAPSLLVGVLAAQPAGTDVLMVVMRGARLGALHRVAAGAAVERRAATTSAAGRCRRSCTLKEKHLHVPCTYEGA